VIGLVNMSTGNLLSIFNAMQRIGLSCREIASSADLGAVSAIVLPGVGAFGVAMENLKERGFVGPLREMARRGEVPILGICLGMQLLADASEEHGEHEGLGLVPGRVVRLQEDEIQSKVPNVGWCHTAFKKPSVFFPEHGGSRSFYFVHSFHFVPRRPEAVVATTRLGPKEVVAAVESGKVSGVQFHPEKSQDDGLDLLACWATRNGLLGKTPRRGSL